MRAFIITILILEALMVPLRLHRMHRLLQGDEFEKRRPGEYLFDALCGIGIIIWGLFALNAAPQ